MCGEECANPAVFTMNMIILMQPLVHFLATDVGEIYCRHSRSFNFCKRSDLDDIKQKYIPAGPECTSE